MSERAAEQATLPVEERCLTEVDNLNRHRTPEGGHQQWVLDDVFANLVSAVKEAGIPNAVSRTAHPYLPTGEFDANGEEINSYMWLGRTAVQNAESGRVFHKHESALKRVEIEIDEAWDATHNLRPGITKVFISPRMTRKDATYEVAKSEHLADEDSVRASQVVTGPDGSIEKRVVESILAPDIPLYAWHDMAADPGNIFGKAIIVARNGSALPIMGAHREFEVPTENLPKGVLSVFEAVIAYVKEPEVRAKLQHQLERFEEDQEALDATARSIASRWKDFDVELSDSLYYEYATPAIEMFINQLAFNWNEDDLEVILAHQQPDGSYAMSRKLAVILEKAKQNILLASAGVVTGNEKILAQLSEEEADAIRRDEEFIQIAQANGFAQDVVALQAENNRRIASANVKAGGGCMGENEGGFRKNNDPFNPDTNSLNSNNSDTNALNSYDRKNWKLKKGKCIVKDCPTRPQEVKVGPCNVCIDRCQKLYDQGKDPNNKPDPKPVIKEEFLRSLANIGDLQPKYAKTQANQMKYGEKMRIETQPADKASARELIAVR